MKLTTEEFQGILNDLAKILRPGSILKIESHVYSLIRENEDLKKSRDSWKSKYELRNDDAKDYAKTITKLQNQLKK